MDYLENRTFDEIQIGDTAHLSRVLTQKDIQVFAIMSGDLNPAHVDIEYAQSDMFHKIIGHGMWGGALISTVLGTQLPGPGTIYVSQTLRFKKPVVISDTILVKVTVVEKKERNRVRFHCECFNQEEILVIEGEAEVVAPTKKIKRLKTVMPEISLRRPYSLLNSYLNTAAKLAPARTAVLCPTKKKIIAAVYDAKKAGMITPILIGPRNAILSAAKEAQIDVSDMTFVDTDHSQTAISKAITLARNKEIDLIVRGGVTSEELLRHLQKPEKGLLTARHLSYALVLDVPTYDKPLILTDPLVNPDPSLDIKRDILQNAIDFALALGIKQPKVAILAATDTINQSTRSTLDAAALCKMVERGQIKHAIVDGPLTFDSVVSKEAALAKGIQSEIAGDADILMMPNAETANMLAEQLEYLAESKNAGLLLGSKVPVLMSHITDIYSSTVACALAILSNHNGGNNHDKNG